MMTEDVDGAGCAIWGALVLAGLVMLGLLVVGAVGVVKLAAGWAQP